MDMGGGLGQRSRDIAGGADHGIAGDLNFRTVPARADDAAVLHFLEAGLQIDRNLMQCEVLAQIGAVGQADALLGHQVVLHLDDDRLLPLQSQLIGDLAAGQTAADDRDRLLDRSAVQIVAGFDHLLKARHIPEQARRRARRQDDFLIGEFIDAADLRVQMDLNAQLLHLLSVPDQQFAQLAFVGFRAGGNEGSAQPV